MRKPQLLTFVICFLVLWEVSAASDTGKRHPNSECPDSFAVSKAGDPKHIKRLEAFLRHSDSVTKKKLVIKFLGKIGETQPDSSSRVFHILINTFQNVKWDVKKQAMSTATKLVIKLSSEEFASQLIDQLIVVFLREAEDNKMMPIVALNNLQVLIARYGVVAYKEH